MPVSLVRGVEVVKKLANKRVSRALFVCTDAMSGGGRGDISAMSGHPHFPDSLLKMLIKFGQ